MDQYSQRQPVSLTMKTFEFANQEQILRYNTSGWRLIVMVIGIAVTFALLIIGAPWWAYLPILAYQAVLMFVIAPHKTTSVGR